MTAASEKEFCCMELVSFWKLPTKMVTLRNKRLNCLQKLSCKYKYLVGLYSSLNFIDPLGPILSFIMAQNREEEVATNVLYLR
jgi:hypothetical protein